MLTTDVSGDLNVHIDVNTDILAAMIEKSSRTVIRAAAEALLKGDVDVEEKESPKEEAAAEDQTKGQTDAQPTNTDTIDASRINGTAAAAKNQLERAHKFCK